MSAFLEMRRVLAVRRHGPAIVELHIERAGLAHASGDCMALFSDAGRVSRPYSLASGDADPELRFLIREMEGGEVSPFLCSRRPGDRVRVSPPFGWFRPGAHAAQRPFVFLATGTGVAPFFAYLRSPGAVRPAAFRYGCRTAGDLIDLPWLREHGGVDASVSREDVAGCRRGRITDRMEQLPIGDHDYYLCGLDGMIDEATRFLQAAGVALPRIHRECFFNAPARAEG